MNQACKQLLTLAFALVFMAGAAFAQNNDATISSTGNGNDADITQQVENTKTVSDVDAEITQVGARNDAEIVQVSFGSFGPLSNNEATISQVGGNDNVGFIQQYRQGSMSDIDQRGFRNDARTEIFTVGATTSQLQIGDDNRARIRKTTQYTGFSNSGSLVTQEQRGNGNTAIAELANNNNESVQYQRGNANFVEVDGLGRETENYQEQIGDRNTAILRTGAEQATGVEVSMIQRGSDNLIRVAEFDGSTPRLSGPGTAPGLVTVDVDQLGDRNTLRADYNGFLDNNMTVRQVHNDNFARVTFTQEGNTASVMQNGNGNDAVVNQ
jgi:hypothetical protein